MKRGANPNASSLPLPVIFFPVKSADTTAVLALLEQGADTAARTNQKVSIFEKKSPTPFEARVKTKKSQRNKFFSL